MQGLEFHTLRRAASSRYSCRQSLLPRSPARGWPQGACQTPAHPGLLQLLVPVEHLLLLPAAGVLPKLVHQPSPIDSLQDLSLVVISGGGGSGIGALDAGRCCGGSSLVGLTQPCGADPRRGQGTALTAWLGSASRRSCCCFSSSGPRAEPLLLSAGT